MTEKSKPNSYEEFLLKALDGMIKMDNSARIPLDEDVSMRATVDAGLNKNGYAANLATSRAEAAKRRDDASFNSTLKDDRLPDIERITQSLLKVQEITAAAHLLWPNKKTAEKITTNAVEIINQVCKKILVLQRKKFKVPCGRIILSSGLQV